MDAKIQQPAPTTKFPFISNFLDYLMARASERSNPQVAAGRSEARPAVVYTSRNGCPRYAAGLADGFDLRLPEDWTSFEARFSGGLGLFHAVKCVRRARWQLEKRGKCRCV
ncbi:hypothetical protein B5F77_00235 [Parabacteroides sp. An277]|nr:hypothetical protein B5F77_00235 [Parabacteroides sp. An277]